MANAKKKSTKAAPKTSKKKAPKKAVKKASPVLKVVETKTPYGPYHANGGLGILDWYADACEIDFDPLTMVSSRYRIKRTPGKQVDADKRIKYLVSLFKSAIDLAVENGDGKWFVRIIRHQIAANLEGEIEKGAPLKIKGATIHSPAYYA
jgi:hypothetical protein